MFTPSPASSAGPPRLLALAWLTWLVISVGGPWTAAAQPPDAALQSHMMGEFAGGRAQAMGRAHRGIGRNNEAIILNPAGMAMMPRYSIEMQYGYRGEGHLNDVTASVVDSKSSRLAAGLRATRIWGNPSGLDVGLYQLAAGSAWSLGERLALGVTAKNHRGHWRPSPRSDEQEISSWSGTVGMMARLSQALSLGVTWENVLHGDLAHSVMLRPAAGAGLGVQLGRLSIAADGRIDLRPGASRLPDLAAGVEVMPLSAVACSLGYYTDQVLVGLPRRQAITGGLGLRSPTAGFLLSLERGLGAGSAWGVFTGLNLSV